jgi:tetratricopeptide (TPR) repeat protein
MLRYIIAVIFVTFSLLRSSPASDFNEANLFYEKGDYEGSIKLLEKIIAGGSENGEIYYNLGNSYYKAGDIVNCIVNYERALKFLPGDTDLVENLKIARLSLIDKTEEQSVVPFFTFYSNIRNGFNIYSASKAFYLLLLITAVLISLYIILKNTFMNKFVMAAAFTSLAVLIFFTYMYYDIHALNSKRFGVISSDKISVLSSPDENVNSKELFFLHKGTKAEIYRSNEGWFEIGLDEEKKGWVKKDSVIEI